MIINHPFSFLLFTRPFHIYKKNLPAKKKRRRRKWSFFIPMADIRLKSNHQLTQQLQTLESLFACLNPPSKSRSQFNPANLPLQRGRMYEAYAALRESKLLEKKAETELKTPPKKKVSFLNGPLSTRTDLAVARSVPDLSAALRKENKKPNSSLLQVCLLVISFYLLHCWLHNDLWFLQF